LSFSFKISTIVIESQEHSEAKGANMEIYLKTWPEVEAYLKDKRSLILPVGSTEQHGPTGLIGTDFLTAWDIAKKVGEKIEVMVASPVCYGMALHHLAFPGSSALKPSTYIAMLKEIISNYARHGFRDFYVINGHGGNIPSLQATFSELLDGDQDYQFQLFNWWHLPDVTKYEQETFGEANGFHATCGEVSVTMATHPEAFNIEREYQHFETPKSYSWPKSPVEFRKTFPDGRMGSNPSLATRAHGEKIFNLAVNAIADSILKKGPNR
jgi:creatinine amidohydrolase